MCQLVEIDRGAVPSNIEIFFERDASLRAMEIIVINKDREGNECEAVKMIASDNGTFYKVGKAVDLIVYLCRLLSLYSLPPESVSFFTFLL